jgi:uncharacterized protein (TIGR03067 family)
MRTGAVLLLLAGLSVIVCARGAGGFAPAPVRKEDTGKAALKKLAGTWSLVSLSRAGRAMPVPTEVLAMKAVIKGDRWKFTRPAMRGPEPEYTIVLDPSKKPKEMDLKMVRGKDAMVVHGIYTLKGDTLTFCYYNPTRGSPKEARPERPKAFTTGDTRAHSMTLKRDKR